MKSLINRRIAMLVVLLPTMSSAQLFTSNGATISVESGGIVMCNGGLSLTNGSSLTNDGEIRITKNSSFTLPGTFTNSSLSATNGSGEYYVEQDWVNDATFTANNSIVHLYGNTQQSITSTNGTVTEFNDLVLTGTGSGADRKKTLQNVDARISTTGTLTINNRELSTQTNRMTVLNPSANAITNSLTFGAEGFVSSENPGYLTWSTNSSNNYYFPVGSSTGTLRYRPVVLQPSSANASSYSVRLDNFSGDAASFFLAQHDTELDVLNPNFFHSIERESGTAGTDIAIAYDPSNDGEWDEMGHWSNAQAQWNNMSPTTKSTLGNYSSIEKASWSYPDVYYPFVLATVSEELNIPNVFTPNNDGANDTYFVTGKGITEFNITIVNRWGNPVFEANDINIAWDGTSDGKPCVDGVYFYIIKAKSNTKDYDKHGHITLQSGN